MLMIELTSSRPKNTQSHAEAKKNALRRFGGAYGWFSSHLMPPNQLG
jgi:hypothetical protein